MPGIGSAANALPVRPLSPPFHFRIFQISSLTTPNLTFIDYRCDSLIILRHKKLSMIIQTI
jgi:hypothetical protein